MTKSVKRSSGNAVKSDHGDELPMAMAKNLDNIERIDRLTTIAETCGNAMLREIDRRHVVLGQVLRRQVEEVEGEFEVIEKTPAEAKSAV